MSKPWEDDLLAKDDSEERLSFNGFTYVPFALLNGKSAGGNSSAYSITDSKILQEYEKQQYFNFEVKGTLTGTNPHTCEIIVTVTAVDNYSSNSELRLFTAAIEDDIDYNDIYGSPAKNGRDDYSHVVRKLLPTAEGESLGSQIVSGEANTFTYSYSNDDVYQNYTNIKVLVFVQDIGTKEILGVFQTSDHPFQIQTDLMTSDNVKYPGEFAITDLNGTKVSFTVPADGDVILTLYSLDGTVLYKKSLTALNKGSHVIIMEDLNTGSTCNILTLSIGAMQVSKKFLLVR